jgi:hypothetical protein
MLAMSRRAAHPRGALALLSLAKLSGHAAQRRAGTLGWRDEEQVQAEVVNAQVQLRENGVREPDPDRLWAIDRAARECVEKAATERESLHAEERRRLLREGMLLLGHWPQTGQQTGAGGVPEPSQEWQRLFDLVCEEARQLADEQDLVRQLALEALYGAGKVRMGLQGGWPQHSVQYRFLQRKVQ